MAKQSFTTGSVLTAAQMNSLQANDYNWTVSQKTASYVLTAADAGTRIEMNAAGATSVTVNTGLFTAGDSVIIQNIGAGTCTVTAGTATVNKATNASLALAQYQAGTLYFISASNAIFFPFNVGSAASSATGVMAHRSTAQTITSATYTNVSFNAETFDTNAFHDNTTNADRLTIPAGQDGYYLIQTQITFAASNTGNRWCFINKNGSTMCQLWNANPSIQASSQTYMRGTFIANLVAGDYITIQVRHDVGSNLDVNPGADSTWASLWKIG